MEGYDFSGWATKNNIRCSDGRTIMKDAFKHCDGAKVPLTWNHQHNDPDRILGHALLENREDGVYAYCSFNDTESGKIAKQLVQHGDIFSMSIYANQLKQQGGNVMHGSIREVALVLAGANPGALINTVVHGEDTDDEAVIYMGEEICLYHSDEKATETTTKKSEKEETVKDVFDTLTEKQKTVVYALIGQALSDQQEKNEKESSKEENSMKHNVFDSDETQQDSVLTHSQMSTIISDAKRMGSLKESFLAHADEYGIENIDYLFPDDRNATNTPLFIQRDTSWVSQLMGKVHHTPFSRIRSMYADITEDEARAKGYIKGNKKKEEVFTLLKRSTSPQTIYKKQKLDRDDVVDITDFDVVAWLKTEMRTMLDEEIARAVLVGDGRSTADDDKIQESNVRPIWTDDELYTIAADVSVDSDASDDTVAKAFIRAAIKSRKDYKGSGNPILFTTEDVLTDCLLMEDGIGRIIYDTQEKLATALRVKDIVTVPVMENLSREVSGVTRELMGIIVNPADYNIGADKGGAINMFDDFDIDYNQQKYLIETRCSGALVKPYSAIALEKVVAAS